MNARAVALRALRRIDEQGGYANLVLAAELEHHDLERRDRAFVTALVDGTTRMRRGCDHVVDRFVHRRVDPEVRRVLRLGAYQLVWLGTPAHAAVSATVDAAPRRARGFVNAVLRRVSENLLDPDDPAAWPDEATRLSYPDWIVERLRTDLGAERALGCLAAMNAPAPATVRPDGYVQDDASAQVVELVGGGRVVDLCAAPGGKATALAGRGARVVAVDHRLNRARLVARNAVRTGTRVPVVVADGRAVPVGDRTADAVLVDAPCSGLGSLRRRADARWRIDADAVDRLAELQHRLLEEAVRLVRPGGRIVYSVCTLTAAETTGVVDRFDAAHPEFTAQRPPSPWEPLGTGGQLLPTVGGRDGMSVFVRVAPDPPGSVPRS